MEIGRIITAYEWAKEKYMALGVNVETSLDELQSLPISLSYTYLEYPWGSDLFPRLLSTKKMAPDNCSEQKQNLNEIKTDLEKVISLVPGTLRLNLPSGFGNLQKEYTANEHLSISNFEDWVEWAKQQKIELDFNTLLYSHSENGLLTLANPDKRIRDFWIDHVKRCRVIADEIGRRQNSPCTMNLSVYDRFKENTVQKIKYRNILKNSLDEIYFRNYKHIKDCINPGFLGREFEGESVGSYDFYLSYCLKKNKIITLNPDCSHWVGNVSDKISSLLLFMAEFSLRMNTTLWQDPAYKIVASEEIARSAYEVVRANAMTQVHIGLDYSNETINRVGNYVVSIRSIQKSFLKALLEPVELLTSLEQSEKSFERLALFEEAKCLPWNAVWNYYCLKNNVPIEDQFIEEVQDYEKQTSIKKNMSVSTTEVYA